MTTDEKSRDLGKDGNESAAERQRLPWHAPQLIKSTSVQHLTGTHTRTSGGDSHPTRSSTS